VGPFVKEGRGLEINLCARVGGFENVKGGVGKVFAGKKKAVKKALGKRGPNKGEKKKKAA